MRYSHAWLVPGVLALALSLALPADIGFAAGGGGGGSSAGGGSSSGGGGSSGSSSKSTSSKTQYAQAKAKIEAKDYRGAKPMLEKLLAKNPRDADVLNLMGYCSRKLGDPDEALEYYQKALAINPKHIGANEYLGELYLEMKDLAKAEERLQVLTRACNGCEEQEELEERIADYKASNS
jgi:tetratricopeptide (TPR) repeat protein